MKVKKVVKKIAALAGGATMLGATIMGALAVSDLASWKDMFIQDGQWTGGHIVLGANAKTEDVIAAVGLAATLQQWAVTKEPVQGGTVTVEGGVTENFDLGTPLNDATAFGSSLDDNDVSVLEDSTFDWNGTNYDYYTQVVFTNGARATTSLYEGDRDFGGDPVLVFEPSSVEYDFIIDDANFGNTQIDGISPDYPLEVPFLGMDIKITDWDRTNNKITVEVAQEHYMKVGDSVQSGSHTVELVNVGQDSVIVSVDGQTEIINKGATKTVNGVKVKVKSIFYVDQQDERAAILQVGDEITKTYADGDEFIGEDENEPLWVWVIDSTNKKIGVKLNQYIGSSDYPAKGVGDALFLPQNFIKVSFDGLKHDNYREFTIKKVQSKSIDTNKNGQIESGETYDVLEIKSKDADKGLVFASDEVDTAYALFHWNGSVGEWQFWYKDNNGNWHNETSFKMEYGDTQYTVQDDGTDKIKIQRTIGSTTETITLDARHATASAAGWYDFTGFGADTENAEATDAVYSFTGHSDVNFGGWDGDALTTFGVKLLDVNNNMDNNELDMFVPDDRVQAVVSVAPGQATTETSGAYTEVVNPLPADVSILDTDYTGGPAIVVGGPCVNTLAAELMGNPANCVEGFEPGYGLIKLFPDRDALLVAGYAAEDTQAAVSVLENYENYLDSLQGKTEVRVVTSTKTVTDVETQAPSEGAGNETGNETGQ